MMPAALAGLEPGGVWARFGELTAIARPPGGEEAVREHVLGWARERRLTTNTDEAGNVVVRVPATDGRDRSPAIALQAHLDMVCERDPDSPYDPRAGRIHLVRSDDWVFAAGTTLGADNGVGVAAALAVADDPLVPHGPLELLFTVCEEEGLEGAKALDASLVTARLLLNLDGSSDGALTIGCAGSAHTFVRAALQPAPRDEGDVGLHVAVSGARGGHSGGDIANGRANAIQLLGSLLRAGGEAARIRLARLGGGVSRNAIPREAEAVIAVPDAQTETFRDAAERAFAEARRRFAASDGGLTLTIGDASEVAAADAESTQRAFDLLGAIPVGVVAMSHVSPDTAETSTSLNVASTEDAVLTLASMTRSSVLARLDEVVETIERVARAHGAEVAVKRSYAPWEPEPESELVSTASATYARLFGALPSLRVVHGGLECAVLGERLPGVQMIALGAEIEGPHAPGERVSVSSTQRFYRLLSALLDDLSR